MNWYNNSNNYIYLRLGQIYFRRVNGVGWQIISQQEADQAIRQWDHLHEKQYAVYHPQLRQQGLI